MLGERMASGVMVVVEGIMVLGIGSVMLPPTAW